MKKFFLLLSILGYFTFVITSAELIYKKSWELKMNDNIILAGAGEFSVDQDEFIYIPDIKMSNIKLFSNTGLLLTKFGVKGLGPDEFLRPCYSYIHGDEIIITDSGRRMYFLYKIGEKKKLVNLQSGRIDAVYDISMDSKNIYVAGYIVSNGKEFELFSIDKSSKTIKTYLPINKKYTPIGGVEYSRKNIPEFAAIGVAAYTGVHKSKLYYVWEGDLKIHKINTHDKSYASFGKKTDNYIRPFLSSKMKKGIFEKNWKVKIEERNKMSHIDSLMVNSKYMILSFLSPNQSKSRRIRYFQFYTHNGDFITEFLAPKRIRYGDEEEGVTFVLKGKILYANHRYVDEDENETFEAIKYEIK